MACGKICPKTSKVGGLQIDQVFEIDHKFCFEIQSVVLKNGYYRDMNMKRHHT